MDTTTKTIDQFIADHKLTMRAERTDSNPNMPDSRNMDHWKVTIRNGRARMSLVFSQGYGHNGAEPTLASVLNCLASDASSIEGNDFDSWAADMGYDTDSRTAHRTYKAIEGQMRKLGRLLGPDAYSELLWDLERL